MIRTKKTKSPLRGFLFFFSYEKEKKLLALRSTLLCGLLYGFLCSFLYSLLHSLFRGLLYRLLDGLLYCLFLSCHNDHLLPSSSRHLTLSERENFLWHTTFLYLLFVRGTKVFSCSSIIYHLQKNQSIFFTCQESYKKISSLSKKIIKKRNGKKSQLHKIKKYFRRTKVFSARIA